VPKQGGAPPIPGVDNGNRFPNCLPEQCNAEALNKLNTTKLDIFEPGEAACCGYYGPEDEEKYAWVPKGEGDTAFVRNTSPNCILHQCSASELNTLNTTWVGGRAPGSLACCVTDKNEDSEGEGITYAWVATGQGDKN
jgi:hypothetical protein